MRENDEIRNNGATNIQRIERKILVARSTILFSLYIQGPTQHLSPLVGPKPLVRFLCNIRHFEDNFVADLKLVTI